MRDYAANDFSEIAKRREELRNPSPVEESPKFPRGAQNPGPYLPVLVSWWCSQCSSTRTGGCFNVMCPTPINC